MAQHRITIEVNHEPGAIPVLKITAPELTGPNLVYYLRTLLHELEAQVLIATVVARLAEREPPVSAGGIILPGLVPPKEFRG